MSRVKASSSGPKVSDWMKKTLVNAIEQADKTKKDISTLVAKEVRLFLDSLEVADLLKKVLADQTIEISASIKFLSPKKAASSAASKKSHKKI